MKLTRHNGRVGKNGVYNPKHNDRSFNINNSEHIDEERAKGNIYWDCFNGYRTFYDKEKNFPYKKDNHSYFFPLNLSLMPCLMPFPRTNAF